MKSDSKKKILALVKKIALYLLYAAVAYFILDKLAGTKDIVGQLSNISLPFLLIGIVIYALQVYLNTIIWYFMMRSTGEDVTIQSQIDVYLRSYMLRYIPGNVVGMLSRGEFNKKYGVARVKSLWAWFLENIVFLVIGMSLGSYFVFKNITSILDLSHYITSRNDVVMISGIALVVVTGITGFLLLNKGEKLVEIFNKYIAKRLLKDKYRKDVSIKFSGLSQIVVVLGYIAAWGLYSLSFLFIVYAISPSSVTYPLALASVNALSWAVGFIVIITPSGTGVREAAFAALLPLVNSITAPLAVIIALAMRLTTILGEVLAFATFEIYLFIKNKYGRK